MKGAAQSPDGVICPHCKTRLRLKYYPMFWVLNGLLLVATGVILFPSGFYLIKLVLICVFWFIFFVALSKWPLAIHPWIEKSESFKRSKLDDAFDQQRYPSILLKKGWKSLGRMKYSFGKYHIWFDTPTCAVVFEGDRRIAEFYATDDQEFIEFAEQWK